MAATKITLGRLDAALVLRADGGDEGFLPDVPDDAEMPPNGAFIAACMFALQDPETNRLLRDRWQAHLDATKER